ncbi:MAG: type II and III secretion system protein family protein [Kiloniellales bacterium]|nr:type II and III secretion system protein family protein [Kiloniellales bacterium]
MISLRNCRRGLAALGFIAFALVGNVDDALGAASANSGAEQPIQVEISEGRLIKLSAAANSVFIANPGIADVAVKSPRLVYIFGKKTGETTLYAVDRNDRLIASLKVEVVHNVSRLNDTLSAFVSSGSVEAVSIDGAIILRGYVTDPADAENARRLAERFIEKEEEVINRIAVAGPNQVNLRVRIAEVERAVVKQFGFNWEIAFENADIALALATGGNPFTLPVLRDGSVDNAVGVGDAGNFDINGLIDALAQDSMISILAEPNLTAMSGETASFLAGGEFPIPVVEEDGRVTVIFKEFGVSLAFTPTVLSQDRISMRVRPEVSELSTAGAIQLQGTILPGIRTRRAETTIEVASGQSFALAGLLQDSSEESLRGTPALQEIPILGELFKSDRFERNETELLIIATPYLVQPTNQRLPLPTDPFMKQDPSAPRGGFLAGAPNAPATIPLNAQIPLAQNSEFRAEFIVE